jgi:hypothetical protein
MGGEGKEQEEGEEEPAETYSDGIILLPSAVATAAAGHALACAALREMGRDRMSLGFRGGATTASFVRPKNADGRPIKINSHGTLGPK